MEKEEEEGKGEGHKKAGKMTRWRKRKKLIEEGGRKGKKAGKKGSRPHSDFQKSAPVVL